MGENLPRRHPSEYADPLKSEEGKEVGVSRTGKIHMAIGNGSDGEWIRMVR